MIQTKLMIETKLQWRHVDIQYVFDMLDIFHMLDTFNVFLISFHRPTLIYSNGSWKKPERSWMSTNDRVK